MQTLFKISVLASVIVPVWRKRIRSRLPSVPAVKPGSIKWQAMPFVNL